jgi:hypothetical protein
MAPQVLKVLCTCSFVACETTNEACMMLQLHLPAHPRHKLLKSLTAAGVGKDADLVLLSLSHIDDSDLVRFPPLLIVQILQFTYCNTT